MSDPVRAVLFDLGKVLMAYDVRRITDGIAAHLPGVSGDEVLGVPGAWDVVGKAETGELGSGELRDLLNRRFGLDLSESEWSDIWALGIVGPMEGTESLVRRLAPQYTLGVLSNTVPWHWDEALRRIPALDVIGYYFLSYELGVRKPDPEIFRIALETLGTAPGEVVFVDDRKENVESAAGVGLRGVLFTDAATLAEDFERMGILGPSSKGPDTTLE